MSGRLYCVVFYVVKPTLLKKGREKLLAIRKLLLILRFVL